VRAYETNTYFTQGLDSLTVNPITASSKYQSNSCNVMQMWVYNINYD